MPIKGVIFDMDNTLLRSNINFDLMKHETYNFLYTNEILPQNYPLHNETSSTIIQAAFKTNKMTQPLIAEMWEISKKYELEGMDGAGLEPGVRELLEQLHGKYRLAVVTNNSFEAAQSALLDNRIHHYFDLIAGRETMKHLKPAPDGFLYFLNQYRDLSEKQWISVGDSWVDGKGSQEAGIAFISYRSDPIKMNAAGVYPDGRIEHISELLYILDGIR